MKPLVRLALLSIALACAASRAGDEAPAALYSFADLYRLTVSAPPSAGLAFAEPQIRLAAREPEFAAAPRFAVTPVPGPGRWALLLAGLAAAGCERAAADRAQTQLVARVNGVEISARELRAAGAASMAQAVDKVIDRELLVQKALQSGLERDPQVALDIDNARREVLAQAYVERAARTRAAPTRDEVRAFYVENPALFAERRIYRTRELVVSANPEMIDVLRARVARAADLDEVAAWLNSRNARYSVLSQTQAAEEIALAFLPQLARMSPGELAVFAAPAVGNFPATANVVQLIYSESAPLAYEQASPLIESFLAGRKRLAVAQDEVKRLREVARIEYVAQFKQSTR